MILPLLPPSGRYSIPRAFILIEDYAERTNITDLVDEFLQYFREFWMMRVKPHNFSVYGVPRRTNNDLEGLNSSLKRKIGQRRNLHEFLSKHCNVISTCT